LNLHPSRIGFLQPGLAEVSEFVMVFGNRAGKPNNRSVALRCHRERSEAIRELQGIASLRSQ
jgi:hypothetical protein